MTTTAAILVEQNKPLQLREIFLPQLGPHQVLVRLKYAGICRSQINEIKGLKGEDPYLPHTLGHEGAGDVLQVGSEVTHVQPGDKVVISWLRNNNAKSAGPTQYMDTDQSSKINSGPVSTFLTTAVISQDRLLKIDDSIPYDIAALFGCAIPTGMGMVFNQMKLKETSSIAIFGTGGVGLCALIAASLLSPRILCAIDISDEKLMLAKELGATHTINPLKENVEKVIAAITSSQGFDYTIESAGRNEVMELAFRSVRCNGGKCIIAGNVSQDEKISLDPFDLIKGKRIEGTWGGGMDVNSGIPMLLDRLKGKYELLRKLIGTYKPLTEINELIQMIDTGKIARGFIQF